jgi:O-antigen/teichoic acid export membrane protein
VLITGFIVPAFLTIEQYAYLKTFALVLSFVGVFHFGFTDGVYLKYGGKYLKDIDLRIINIERIFFISFQVLIALIILIAGLILNEPIIIGISAATLPYNLLSYYQLFYQSVGQFNIYSWIKLTVPLFILISNLLLIFIIKSSNYLYFITGEIASYILVVLFIELTHSHKIGKFNIKECLSMLSDNFKVGFAIMMGNLALIVFSTLGRWVVKIWMSDADFAYFSFASSMMQVITVVISSIALTFYPYLSRISQVKDFSRLKIQLIITGVFLSSSYFALKFIVMNFIPKYLDSLSILGFLFASLPAYIVVNALYINLYKVNKDGRKYINVILINLAGALFVTLIAVVIYNSPISVAIASTIAYYFWMYYASRDFKELKPDFKETAFVFFYLLIFFGASLFPNPIIGILVFLLLFIALASLYRLEVGELFTKIISLVKPDMKNESR